MSTWPADIGPGGRSPRRTRGRDCEGCVPLPAGRGPRCWRGSRRVARRRPRVLAGDCGLDHARHRILPAPEHHRRANRYQLPAVDLDPRLADQGRRRALVPHLQVLGDKLGLTGWRSVSGNRDVAAEQEAVLWVRIPDICLTEVFPARVTDAGGEKGGQDDRAAGQVQLVPVGARTAPTAAANTTTRRASMRPELRTCGREPLYRSIARAPWIPHVGDRRRCPLDPP